MITPVNYIMKRNYLYIIGWVACFHLVNKVTAIQVALLLTMQDALQVFTKKRSAIIYIPVVSFKYN